MAELMNGWMDFATAPKEGCILVWLEERSLGSHIQVMRRGKVNLIGSNFAFDMPKPLYWQPLPDAPSTQPADEEGAK